MDLIFHYDKNLPKVTPMNEKFLCDKVEYLKTLPQHAQKSAGWYEMRMSLLSASDWGTILGVNHYSKPEAVLLKKCGEDNFMTNDAMKWGNKYEDVAIAIYEYRNNTKIYEFGCIRHPFIKHLGASPDGITADGIMLEIKCPVSRQITGIPPEYYWCQVQGQLEVCELNRCDFLECKLREYDNEEEYLNDNYEGDNTRNKIGFEKGIVVEFYKINEQSFYYDYSPVCIIGEEMEKWKSHVVNKHTSDNPNVIFSTFDYWTLDEVSCVPIFRNQEWFQRAEKELTKFWKRISKYRSHSIEMLKYDPIFDVEIWDESKENELIGFWTRALNYRDINKLREDPIFEKQYLFKNVREEFDNFWGRVQIYRDEGIKKIKEDLSDEKCEKKRIKQQERDEKNKVKEDTKKQKKIKEYIVLDDSMENKMDIEDEEKEKNIEIKKVSKKIREKSEEEIYMLSEGFSFFTDSNFTTGTEIVDRKPTLDEQNDDEEEYGSNTMFSSGSFFS